MSPWSKSLVPKLEPKWFKKLEPVLEKKSGIWLRGHLKLVLFFGTKMVPKMRTKMCPTGTIFGSHFWNHFGSSFLVHFSVPLFKS